MVQGSKNTIRLSDHWLFLTLVWSPLHHMHASKATILNMNAVHQCKSHAPPLHDHIWLNIYSHVDEAHIHMWMRLIQVEPPVEFTFMHRYKQ